MNGSMTYLIWLMTSDGLTYNLFNLSDLFNLERLNKSYYHSVTDLRSQENNVRPTMPEDSASMKLGVA